MVVRFFAGEYDDDLCARADLVERGYESGVPMGGVLEPGRFTDAPRFVVQALRDPGTADFPGALLQRVQIVKGWLDDGGELHELVYDVAGDPGNGATVDPETCVAAGPGFDSLCAVWNDPSFDSSERAFYYARVLENPTCRWHSFVCNEQGARCDQPATVPEKFANCCDPLFPRAIQERAWTSPIFYSPNAPQGVHREAEGAGRPWWRRWRVCAVTSLGLGCGGGDDDSVESSTPSPTPTQQALATPTEEPDSVTLTGTIIAINEYPDGHPHQLGIAIEPDEDTVWSVDGLEHVYFWDGPLARELGAESGRSVEVRGPLADGESLSADDLPALVPTGRAGCLRRADRADLRGRLDRRYGRGSGTIPGRTPASTGSRRRRCRDPFARVEQIPRAALSDRSKDPRARDGWRGRRDEGRRLRGPRGQIPRSRPATASV